VSKVDEPNQQNSRPSSSEGLNDGPAALAVLVLVIALIALTVYLI
jgi:hypothetical protein